MEQTDVKWNGAVHPAAEIFPMLSNSELEELAEDIKKNGLLNLCTLAPDGTLLDGRNRIAACKKAKTKPLFTITDIDPVTFILSQNNRRRHIKPGQRAIVAALIWVHEHPEWKNGDKPHGKSGPRSKNTTAQSAQLSLREMAVNSGVHAQTILQAFDVIEFYEEGVEEVRSGACSMNKAHDKAIARKKQSAVYISQLNELPDDLRERVDDDDLDIEDAVLEVKKRAAIEAAEGIINDALREFIKAPAELLEPTRTAMREAIGIEYLAAVKKGASWSQFNELTCAMQVGDEMLGLTRRDATGYSKFLARTRQVADFFSTEKADIELLVSAQNQDNFEDDLAICQKAADLLSHFIDLCRKAANERLQTGN
jgi:DNA-binding transcriptional regulator YhcF (GntR family)